jgi:plastocyanin
MKKLALTLGLAVVASLALVACGGSSSSTSATSTPATTPASGGGGGGGSSSGSSSGGASSTVSLAADPSQIAYDTTSLSAKSGNVTIDFNNPNSALSHDVCVQAGSGQPQCSKQITGGKTTLDLKNLKPGSYTFYCSVDSHEAAGMKGTLTVQ